MNTLLGEFGILAQQAAARSNGAGGLSTGTVLLVIFVTIGLPIILGQLLARWLKVPKFATRLSIVMLALFLSLAPFAYHVINGRSWTEAIRLGIDLAGGTNLVFQVDVEAARKEGKDVSASIDRMIGAISRRINPSGTEEVVVRKVGRDRIEVIIPGADPQVVEEKKRLMTNLGSLEFAVLANRRDHGAIIEAATKLPDNVDEYRQGKRLVAIWRKVADDAELGGGDIAIREVERKGERIRQVLVVVPPEEERVTGRFLVRAEPTIDEMGRPAVAFTFNQTGAYRFTRLTSRYRPRPDGSKRQLAIILNNEVESAPSINDVIGRNGIITGNFTQQEIRELTNVLNAGALEIPIKPKPVSEFTISPLLGHDIQEKGKRSIIVGAIAVVVFMAVYYRTCGWIANVCLLVNLILIMGTMALIQAAFTLPGLAGLVLTIGMAVDANVLIFERMREEVHRGASVRMAIHNGFGRAFTTIVDANLTTLITAVILYIIGTDQVKGFAVLLFVGIVMSMFSALYVGRLIFDILEQRRWLREIKMWALVGETQWDFLGKRRIAYVASALIIGCGMMGLVARGADNLDIDFRGGTMVTFEFVQPQETATVKRILEQRLGVGITLEPLRLSEEESASGDVSKRFRLRSTLDDLDRLRHEVAQALSEAGLELRRVTVELGEIRSIPQEQEATSPARTQSAPSEATGSATPPVEGPALVAPGKTEPAKPPSQKSGGDEENGASKAAGKPDTDASGAGEKSEKVAPGKTQEPSGAAEAARLRGVPAGGGGVGRPFASGRAALSAARQNAVADRPATSFTSSVATALAEDAPNAAEASASTASGDSPAGKEAGQTERGATDTAKDAATRSEEAQGQAAGQETASEQAAGGEDAVHVDTHGFEGGHRVTLRFSDEMSPAVVADMIAQAIIRVDPSYTDPQGLIKLIGTRGSGLKAGTYQVQKFSEMELLASPSLDRDVLEKALRQWQQEMAETPTFEEVTNFDSAVGVEMQETALMAILVSLIAIVAYIWFRFQQITFGLAAVIALVHDVLATLGMLALASYLADTPVGRLLLLYDFKINLPIIAALLTIIGYSLNDTIVVFDRIREVRGKNPALTEEMINTSLNQTLSRTLLTSLTTLLVVLVLYVMGGEGIHGFAFSLVVGVIVGTYSSIYIASPSLLWLTKKLAHPAAAGAARKPVAVR